MNTLESLKYTIKNVVAFLFFSLAMRVARFAYEYMSVELQTEIGAIFTGGLTKRASDWVCECVNPVENTNVKNHCGYCGYPLPPRR